LTPDADLRGALMIVVDQPVVLIDAAIAIELRGFPARQPVTVTATQIFPSGSRWQARATFMSDDDGCVYVARQAPVSGTYDGGAAMGLIWSAEPVPAETKPPPADFIMWPWFVQLDATSPGGMRAELTVERRVAGPGVTRHVIRSDG